MNGGKKHPSGVSLQFTVAKEIGKGNGKGLERQRCIIPFIFPLDIYMWPFVFFYVPPFFL